MFGKYKRGKVRKLIWKDYIPHTKKSHRYKRHRYNKHLYDGVSQSQFSSEENKSYIWSYESTFVKHNKLKDRRECKRFYKYPLKLYNKKKRRKYTLSAPNDVKSIKSSNAVRCSKKLYRNSKFNAYQSMLSCWLSGSQLTSCNTLYDVSSFSRSICSTLTSSQLQTQISDAYSAGKDISCSSFLRSIAQSQTSACSASIWHNGSSTIINPYSPIGDTCISFGSSFSSTLISSYAQSDKDSVCTTFSTETSSYSSVILPKRKFKSRARDYYIKLSRHKCNRKTKKRQQKPKLEENCKKRRRRQPARKSIVSRKLTKKSVQSYIRNAARTAGYGYRFGNGALTCSNKKIPNREDVNLLKKGTQFMKKMQGYKRRVINKAIAPKKRKRKC